MNESKEREKEQCDYGGSGYTNVNTSQGDASCCGNLEEARKSHFTLPQRRESWSYPGLGPLAQGPYRILQSFLSHLDSDNFLQASKGYSCGDGQKVISLLYIIRTKKILNL